MESIEFLQQIFPADSGFPEDKIRFLVIGKDQPWPGAVHWRTRADIHKLPATAGAEALGFEIKDRDVYFTPHTFLTMDTKVTKADASKTTDVCWVECDDEDLVPEMFRPAPSIIVETSKGRHHVYWLLKEPTACEDVEKTNWRLIHGNGLRKDTGGWHLVKLMRLPGTFSYKRPTPTPVRIREADVDRVYEIPASFHDLPLAPDTIGEDEEHLPMPDVSRLPRRKEIEDKFAFPMELVDILQRERDDRSIALWRAYNICYRLGMDEREAFALLRGTPNDKFTRTWRYNQDAGLWTDITRGFRYAKHPDDTPALLAIRTVRSQKEVPTIDKRKTISNIIFRDLTQRGRVYFDEETLKALYYDGQKVIEMERTDLMWRVLMASRYNCPMGESDYVTVNENLYSLVVSDGERITPRRFAHYDIRRNLLYVYNNGGKVFRLDGQIIETVDNGTDGVLFLEARRNKPFEPTPPPKSHLRNGHTNPVPSLRQAIFSIPNYEDSFETHTATEAAEIAEVWFYAMFFGEFFEARPHLVVAGSTDSGKTMIFQLMQELINGPDQTVTALPTDRSNFENAVSNEHHIFFDNVDTPNKWLQDAIAECATGIQFSRRILYTTNALATFNVKCFLGLTTREPWFSREDVATRLIVLNTQRRHMKLMSTTLLRSIRENRDYLWHEVLTNLNRILSVLGDLDTRETYSLRMASFQVFLRLWAQLNGLDYNRLERIVSYQQVSSALDNSVLFQMLMQWMTKRDRMTQQLLNHGRKVTAEELHRELRGMAEGLGMLRAFDGQIRNTRSLGHKLKEISVDLGSVISMEIVRTKPKGVYRFELINPEAFEDEKEPLGQVNQSSQNGVEPKGTVTKETVTT